MNRFFFIRVFYFFNVYGTYISLVYVLCWWCYFLTWKNSLIEVSIQFLMIFINKRSLTYVSFGKAFNSFGLKLVFWLKSCWFLALMKNVGSQTLAQSLRPTQDFMYLCWIFPAVSSNSLKNRGAFYHKTKTVGEKLLTIFQFNFYNLLLICFWVEIF